jgi:hypothetical protein
MCVVFFSISSHLKFTHDCSLAVLGSWVTMLSLSILARVTSGRRRRGVQWRPEQSRPGGEAAHEATSCSEGTLGWWLPRDRHPEGNPDWITDAPRWGWTPRRFRDTISCFSLTDTIVLLIFEGRSSFRLAHIRLTFVLYVFHLILT